MTILDPADYGGGCGLCALYAAACLCRDAGGAADAVRQSQPTVLIIEPNAVVRFDSVSPGWLNRTAAKDILAALPELQLAIAA